MKEFCVDLQLAKELKENGFPQTTDFKWCEYKDNYPEQWVGYDLSEMGCSDCFVCSAPLSDEILKELPKSLFGTSLEIDRTDMAYYIWYVPIGTDIDKRPKDFVSGNYDEKLSNALAKMYLYLKKEGYIK